MPEPIRAVILAAGKSTRMMSAVPKVVHRILGKEIITYLLDSLLGVGVGAEDIIIVVGENDVLIRRRVNLPVQFVVQNPQLGTAHALLSARQHLENFSGLLLVTPGDNPYITAAELQRLIASHRRLAPACTFLSAVFPIAPPPFGRVIRDRRGRVTGVIEEVDASPRQKRIREVNSAIYLFDNVLVYPRLARITNRNAKQEYYLTDIIRVLRSDRLHVEAVAAADYRLAIGINNRWELQQAQQAFNQENLRRLALEQGITILQPETVTIEHDVEIGQDSVIYPHCYIAAGSRIGRDCRIGPFAYLCRARISDGETVAFEHRQYPAND